MCSLKSNGLRSSEMAQWLKVLVAKPDNLSSTSRSNRVKKSLTLHTGTHAHTKYMSKTISEVVILSAPGKLRKEHHWWFQDSVGYTARPHLSYTCYLE